MSQHPSLRVDAVGTKHRNVLKRFERIKRLMDQEKWKDRNSAFGLPKVKSLKIKVKKAQETPAEEGQEAAAPAAGAAPPSGAAAAAAKGAAKAPEKGTPASGSKAGKEKPKNSPKAK